MATNFSPCKGSYVLNQFPSTVMFGMNGFHRSASGAIQGHHGPLVLDFSPGICTDKLVCHMIISMMTDMYSNQDYQIVSDEIKMGEVAYCFMIIPWYPYKFKCRNGKVMLNLSLQSIHV